MKKRFVLLVMCSTFCALGQGNSPIVSIASPEQGKVYNPADLIEFSGSAYDLEDGEIPGGKLVWNSDVDGYIGSGSKFKKKLSQTDHIITLETRDSQSNEGMDSRMISVDNKDEKSIEKDMPKAIPAKEEISQSKKNEIKTGLIKSGNLKFKGICASFFRKNQNPDLNLFPSEEEMLEDINFSKNLTGCLRNYGLTKQLEKFPELCERAGVDCLPGAWIGKYPEENRKETDALLRIAAKNYSRVKGLIIGNEVILRKDLPIKEFIEIIRSVNSQTNLPVTTADIWSEWMKYPELGAEVDFILVHIHPYWDGISIENAPEYVFKVWQQVAAYFPGKKVVIGETGWPSKGDVRDNAVPSPVNQASFIARFVELAQKNKIEYFYFDLFDESWKIEKEGVCGGAWGVLKEDGSLKTENSFIFNSSEVPKINRLEHKISAKQVSIPLIVYAEDDDEKNAFTPSGWMGDINNVTLDKACATSPHSGKTCTKITYQQGSQGWAGIYWQYPIKNWGMYPGYYLSGAKLLSFWAKGEKGGEKSIFKIGGIKDRKFEFHDSFGPLVSEVITLTADWQKFEIDLSSSDTSNLIGGFCWVTLPYSDSLVVYLDDIIIS